MATLTVTIDVDASGFMDVTAASAYTGVSAMQLRQYATKDDISYEKRPELGNPTGRVKLWFHQDVLDQFVEDRAERKANKGTSSLGGRVQRVKSVLKMVREQVDESNPNKSAAEQVLVEILENEIAVAMAEQAE